MSELVTSLTEPFAEIIFQPYLYKMPNFRSDLPLLLLFFLISITGSSQVLYNADFESTPVGAYTGSNSVSGWTLSSQSLTSCSGSTVWTPGASEFSIVNAPIFGVPNLGNLPASPL